jgi:hypothetical protein
MAKLYRDTLKNGAVLPQKEKVDSSIPVQLDVIAADIEKGFLFNNLLKITPPEQVKTMVDRLSALGVNNTTLVLQGWQKGGIGGNKPSSFEFESKLGGEKAFADLSQYVNSKGENSIITKIL